MKNLKINTAKMLFILSILFVFSSCKKDKDEADTAGPGTYSYQGKTNKVTSGDYRKGNGQGAWIYLAGEGYTEFVQIRFAGLGDYAIPMGTLAYKVPRFAEPYDGTKYFAGGQVITAENPNGDEITGGTVKVEKTGENYVITIDASTAKGPVTGSFTGPLTKI